MGYVISGLKQNREIYTDCTMLKMLISILTYFNNRHYLKHQYIVCEIELDTIYGVICKAIVKQIELM